MLSKSLQSLRTCIALLFMTAPISYFFTPSKITEVKTNWQFLKPISNYFYKREPEKSWIELLQDFEIKKLFEMLRSKIVEFIGNLQFKIFQEKELLIKILFSATMIGLTIILIKTFFKR